MKHKYISTIFPHSDLHNIFVQVLLRPLKALCSFQLQHGAQIHHSKEHLLKNGMYDKPMPKNKRKIKRMEKLVTDHNICPRWGRDWAEKRDLTHLCILTSILHRTVSSGCRHGNYWTFWECVFFFVFFLDNYWELINVTYVFVINFKQIEGKLKCHSVTINRMSLLKTVYIITCCIL